MIVITGGAFQGKLAYAEQHFSVPVTDGTDCTVHEAKTAKILTHFERLVQKLIRSGTDPVKWTESFCKTNPDCTVLITEIGCGIIPLDPDDRNWREATGRCGCILASHAKTVIRLICGIPHALKGALL